jgi:hypothetical protein
VYIPPAPPIPKTSNCPAKTGPAANITVANNTDFDQLIFYLPSQQGEFVKFLTHNNASNGFVNYKIGKTSENIASLRQIGSHRQENYL